MRLTKQNGCSRRWSLFDCRELYVTDLTPVMGTHAGPGVLGMAWWSEEY
jgi:fatty acid-binding protein DegV